MFVERLASAYVKSSSVTSSSTLLATFRKPEGHRQRCGAVALSAVVHSRLHVGRIGGYRRRRRRRAVTWGASVSRFFLSSLFLSNALAGMAGNLLR